MRKCKQHSKYCSKLMYYRWMVYIFARRCTVCTFIHTHTTANASTSLHRIGDVLVDHIANAENFPIKFNDIDEKVQVFHQHYRVHTTRSQWCFELKTTQCFDKRNSVRLASNQLISRTHIRVSSIHETPKSHSICLFFNSVFAYLPWHNDEIAK